MVIQVKIEVDDDCYGDLYQRIEELKGVQSCEELYSEVSDEEEHLKYSKL